MDDFEAYYHYLRGLQPNHREWDAFLQEITTHETHLFRDINQWEWFRGEYLPRRAVLARMEGGPRTLRVWSAACSTGDEAHTIACCVAAACNLQSWSVDILGTDIGVDAIEKAKNGVFNERAMRCVPPEYLRFFAGLKETGAWRARPILANMLRFRTHNLLNPLRENRFDVIFLKNVLIYFDADSKRRVLDNIRSLLRVEGLLVASAAEGIGDLLPDFQRLQPWLYRRVREKGSRR